MFKPHFKEGVEHHLQLGDPLIIPLPEDDLEATTLFCQITHHRSPDLPRTPSPLCLENLAIFCDKYLCAGSVVSYGTLWIQRHSRSRSLEDLSRLLLLAYVLDLPESFATVSREMMAAMKVALALGNKYVISMLLIHDNPTEAVE